MQQREYLIPAKRAMLRVYFDYDVLIVAAFVRRILSQTQSRDPFQMARVAGMAFKIDLHHLIQCLQARQAHGGRNLAHLSIDTEGHHLIVASESVLTIC